jgi:MSHA biogenesis protein MshG
MAAYAWRGRNPRGELLSGEVLAESADAVANQLMSGGIVPVDIRESRAPASGPTVESWWHRLQQRPVQLDDVLVLTRQLYALQKAGVPILRALTGLEASSTQESVGELLRDVRSSLDQGRDLATALSRHPRVFSPFYLAMIRVGEVTGRLAEVYERLALHIEFELDVRARIKQALRYPTMVVVSMGLALVAVNLFVLPRFAEVYAHMQAELPLVTRLLLGFSGWMVRWWPVLAAAVVGLLVGLKLALANPAWRYRWDRAKLRIPVVGPIVLKSTLARFARSFELASRSGVPVSQALSVVARTVDNAFIAARVEQMREGVERGESISRCATAAGVFTPVVLQMITVGEETGELDTLLGEIAQMYERETGYAIKGLAAAIEPILLLIIAVLVLILALGVFMPLWTLGQAAMGRSG